MPSETGLPDNVTKNDELFEKLSHKEAHNVIPAGAIVLAPKTAGSRNLAVVGTMAKSYACLPNGRMEFCVADLPVLAQADDLTTFQTFTLSVVDVTEGDLDGIIVTSNAPADVLFDARLIEPLTARTLRTIDTPLWPDAELDEPDSYKDRGQELAAAAFREQMKADEAQRQHKDDEAQAVADAFKATDPGNRQGFV